MIWAIVALLTIFSFLPVYSAASNLAYTYGDGQTFTYFIKHFVHLFLGFSIIYFIGSIAFYFRDILEKIAQKNNLVITDVIQRPIDNLLAYHKDNIN